MVCVFLLAEPNWSQWEGGSTWNLRHGMFTSLLHLHNHSVSPWFKKKIICPFMHTDTSDLMVRACVWVGWGGVGGGCGVGEIEIRETYNCKFKLTSSVDHCRETHETCLRMCDCWFPVSRFCAFFRINVLHLFKGFLIHTSYCLRLRRPLSEIKPSALGLCSAMTSSQKWSWVDKLLFIAQTGCHTGFTAWPRYRAEHNNISLLEENNTCAHRQEVNRQHLLCDFG